MISAADSIEAWIEEKHTDNRLNEYDVTLTPRTDREPSCTTCFLETTKKPFVIRLRKTNDPYIYDDIRAVCEVDGRDIGFQIWRAGEDDYQWEEVWDRRKGKLYQSSLKFKTFPTTDDPSQVNVNTDDLAVLGTIVITLTLGTTKFKKNSDGIATFKPVEGKALVNDRFIRMVTTTDTVKSEEWQPPYYHFTPKSKIPYHRFVFFYRSRAVLKRLGKIGDNSNSTRQNFTPLIQDRLSTADLPEDESNSGIKQVKEEQEESGGTSTRKCPRSEEILPIPKRRKTRSSYVKEEPM